jgi:hypothetical protein
MWNAPVIGGTGAGLERAGRLFRREYPERGENGGPTGLGRASCNNLDP